MVDKEIVLTLPPRAKIDLRDAGAVRRELAAVYRDMRSGRIDAQDGTRLAYVLSLIGKAHEAEQRERTIDHRAGPPGGVMLIPSPVSEEEWERATREAQAKLIEDTKH